MKSVEDYLHDILREMDDIAEFTCDGRANFMKSRQAQKAVIKSYENIGEIVKRLPQNVRDAHPEIAWGTLAGFRDFLIHSYDRVVPDNVWAAVDDLPSLRQSIEIVLQNLGVD